MLRGSCKVIVSKRKELTDTHTPDILKGSPAQRLPILQPLDGRGGSPFSPAHKLNAVVQQDTHLARQL